MTTTLYDILIILAGLAVFMAIILGLIKLVTVLRKTKPTHPLVKISDAANRKVRYQCICTKGGDIYLGKAFIRVIDIVLVVLFVIVILAGTQIPLLVVILLSSIILVVYIPMYFTIRKEMLVSGHTKRCASKAALFALPYQTQGSWFEIKR